MIISKGRILRYAGIALIVIGIGVAAYPFYTNFVMKGRETDVLNAWDKQINLMTAQANAGETTSESGAQVTEQSGITNNTQSTETKPVETTEAKTTQAPTTKTPIFKISIPKINSNWVVYEGTDTSTLKSGPGHYTGTAMPGQIGPCIIAGHRTTYGSPFNKVDLLIEGDQIILETTDGKQHVYLVTKEIEVLPDDLSSIVMTDYPSLILSTCTPKYYAIRRLLVFGKLVE